MQSSILIIDDEPVAREALIALLGPENYHIEFAQNGMDGLVKAEKIQPDVILLDVMMPNMNGYEACKRIRANPKLAEVPIIMITALDDQTSKVKGIEAGADDFISKPFDKTELRARLRTITRLNRYRRLQVERSRFAWMLEQAQDGYLILAPDDTIRYANQKACSYLGITDKKEISSSKFLEIAKKQYQLRPDIAWEKWPAHVDEPCYLVRAETVTAKAFWLQVDLLKSRDKGTFGRLIQLRDITEKITAEQDIRKFHTIIEHKLRTPISHTQMSLELLLKRIEQHKEIELTDLARNAFEGISRLRNEIDQILRYLSAPLQASQGHAYRLERLSTRVPLIGADLGLKNIKVKLPFALKEIELQLTQQAIEMILIELLSNARKFHPTRSPTVEINISFLNNREVLISIQDDGIRLSPNQLAWAMTPYLQAEKDFTGEVPGMGLGLPLVGTIVWQVNGKVNLRNREDHSGLIVDLILPIIGKE